MYRHFCPKCRTVYYSAAMNEAARPWICGVCRHVVVHSTFVEGEAAGDEEQVADDDARVADDDARVAVAGHRRGSPPPKEKKEP